MSAESIECAIHIDNVDVVEEKENGSKSVVSCDSGVENLDSTFVADLMPSDCDISPEKVDKPMEIDIGNGAPESSSELSSPTSLSSDKGNCFLNFENKGDTAFATSEGRKSLYLNSDKALATSSVSLNDHKVTENNINTSISRSVENISILKEFTANDNNSTTSSTKDLDKDKILSEFSSQKSKVSATQKIVPENPQTLDVRYARLPKDILAPDLGSIVKNVHGIFSSVSGSLKNAYNNSHIVSQKPQIKNVKCIANGKIMSDIFEDVADEKLNETQHNKTPVESNTNSTYSNSMESVSKVGNEEENDPKNEMLRLQIESLERVLFEQRKENTSLRERVKQQVDELQAKDQTFKEFETKVDLMCKRAEQAQKEKDAAVMRYASVECAAIEAKKAAETAAKAERAAIAEKELLNAKLKTARDEKQRICQLYDDKCHELQNSEREVAKVREELKELEGRLKWTQSKLRMEMDVSKESTERAEKLTQQLAELEAAKEAAIANSTDAARAKQLETELKESQAALIMCRHDKEELERRLSTIIQQLDTCRKERDDATAALAEADKQVERLKESNVRLEEEAAELAALRAQAALADTLSAQLQRYCASGCSFKELHYSYRVGVSTISKICKEISSTIWDVLRDEFMKIPDNESKWLEIAKSFDMKANFPHCLGAVDGKHIRVVKPNNTGSMYFNYKDYFSFVLLAVVDSEYRFIFMSVGSYGKECDSSIFKESTIWKKLNDGSLNIPKPRPLHATLQNDMPYVLVGDEAFPLSTNLLRPFGGTHLDHMKKIFNYRLSRARRYVECAFGILANKWRIFHRPLDVHPDTAIEIVKACTVLHNFVREKDGLNFEDIHYAAENPMQEQVQLQNCNPRGGPIANDIRSEFANYFVSTIGSVPWQPEAHG